MAIDPELALLAASGVALAMSAPTLRARVDLTLAKHRSLAGHPRLARRLASVVPFYEYDETRFYRADGAPEDVVAQRRAGFEALAAIYRRRFSESARLTTELAAGLPDLQFTSAYRVPFQFRSHVARHLRSGAVLSASSGTTVVDPDGNRFYDLSGSYGLNVFGYDFYKECIRHGAERVADLGPVLGAYHPLIEYNVKRLREISGLDEVSFHMSGTEAVMQVVRLARFHTRRSHIVRFCGAYHGWWGDVQPGVGNPAPAPRTYTLKDLDERSLRVLARRRDVACVLVNPMQALHPNAMAPSDSGLLDSARNARFQREAYADWLRRVRAVCTERGIVLIFDEVFSGFRLAPGGAQEYFGVRADMVVYGKTLGGGLPVGVVCGRHNLMKRYRDERPLDVCFARGTFNSHPYVMAAMHEFLKQLGTPSVRSLYDGLDERWNARAVDLNGRLRAERLPVQVENMSTIFTTRYTQPSRYNWMLQYYLRAEGLALSWVGTGRLIFCLNLSDADFSVITDRFLAGARAMKRDGWWWFDPHLTDAVIRRQVLREILAGHWLAHHSRGPAARQGSERSATLTPIDESDAGR
jgi:glutamate-1-semialdehyde 2,1-aminomutase